MCGSFDSPTEGKNFVAALHQLLTPQDKCGVAIPESNFCYKNPNAVIRLRSYGWDGKRGNAWAAYKTGYHWPVNKCSACSLSAEIKCTSSWKPYYRG